MILLASRASQATTIVGGNIINQTWTAAGSPYVVQGDITVPSGAYLTIQSGAVVQLASTDGQAAGLDTSRVEITINGTLTVSGTSGSPVTFQAQSGAAAGIWYGIVIGSGATSATIAGALVENAAYGIDDTAAGTVLQVSGTTVKACTYGAYVSAGTPTFSGFNVTGTTYGMQFAAAGGGTVTDGVAASTSGPCPTCRMRRRVFTARSGRTPRWPPG